MDILNIEICVKDEITDVPGAISNEAKANCLKGLKYLNVTFFKFFPKLYSVGHSGADNFFMD
jgi:hypothetical protein